MRTNNKSVIIIIAAILFAAFFMPWITVFVNLSAWDMVFGQASREIDTGFRFVVVIIPIAGILIIYGAAFNNERYPISRQLLFFLPLLTLIVIIIAIAAKVSDNGRSMRSSDFDNLIQAFGIGFWLTLVTSIVLPCLGTGTVANSPSPANNQGTQTGSLYENQNPSRPISKPVYTRPQVNINLPKLDWDKIFVTWGRIFATAKTFATKYKRGLLISSAILIIFILVYNLFIKADPVKDGKKLASNYCACSEELNKNNSIVTQSFLSGFDGKKYKSRLEARNDLNNLLQPAQAKYTTCIQQADLKYKERYADYNADGGRNTYVFEQTYSSLIGTCNANNNNEALAIQNNTEGKIKTIVDPEPDVEKIKSDLIGKNMVGWNFDALSEFDSVKINNISRGSDRIEYTVDLHLAGYTSKDPHDAQILVSYIQGNDGWYFNDVKEIFITYDYLISMSEWTKIYPLKNCRWNVADNQKLLWKTWDWGNEIKSGTDVPGVTLPGSDSYLLKSREGGAITVKFTYRPNN